MRKRLLLCAALAACSGPRPHPPAGQQVLVVQGKVEYGPFRFGKDDLPKLPRRAFRAIPPAGGEEARFEGVALATLLADDMELSKGADTAVVHGPDGYAVPIPLAAVRQLRPVLADKVDGAPTAAWRAASAPLQLAWPNVDQPGIDSDPRMRWWWVGGVTQIDIQSWLATYGRALRVPAGASDEARLGADALQAVCLGCHRVRGVGGTRGPELSDAQVRRDPAAFTTMLRDHLAKASGVAGAPETGPATARQIAAFLQAQELSGSRPEDEVKEPEPPPTAQPMRPRGY